MTLNIIVVGAGIAGLTVAVSLRQAGHSVQIFEKSKFSAEIGAALGLSPNGAHVLKPLGFSFARARAQSYQVWQNADGVLLKVLSSTDFTDSAKRFGSDTVSVHRVDMHNELLRLAQEPVGRNQEVVKLHLSSKVIDGNAAEGWILLEDGSKHYADLIVAADGIHSAIRPLVIGRGNVKVVTTGLNAFRFLISTQKLRDDPELVDLLKWKGQGPTILADPLDPLPERHMVWYDCQDGQVHNFVGISPSRSIPIAEDGTQDFKAALLADFKAYHPNIKHIISIAENVSCWPLSIHDPLSTWVNGKMVLIGDAAHPMLPFGGQGVNQAIEDAGALGCVLEGPLGPDELSARLKVFEDVRIKRASLIQTMSKVRAGKEKEVEQELQQYANPGSTVPGTFGERTAHAFSYNVLTASREALKLAAAC